MRDAARFTRARAARSPSPRLRCCSRLREGDAGHVQPAEVQAARGQRAVAGRRVGAAAGRRARSRTAPAPTAGTSSGRQGVLPLPADEAPTYPVDEHGAIKADLTPGSPPPLLATNPLPITRHTLARGRERFDIYCSPCHSSLATATAWSCGAAFRIRRRTTPIGCATRPTRISTTSSRNGYGMMYSYADRVDAATTAGRSSRTSARCSFRRTRASATCRRNVARSSRKRRGALSAGTRSRA